MISFAETSPMRVQLSDELFCAVGPIVSQPLSDRPIAVTFTITALTAGSVPSQQTRKRLVFMSRPTGSVRLS